MGESVKLTITAQLLKEAEKQGWQKTLYDTLREKGPEGYFQVGDERRADWIYLLPLSKERSVLQLGAEWGHSAVALARRCKAITVVDSDPEKRDFLRLRAEEERLSNLTIVEHSPDHSFDLIAVSEPPENEKDLFNLIYSRLKKGGYAYVAVKNRGLKKLLTLAGFSELTAYAVLPSHAMPLFFVPLSSPAPLQYFLRHVFYLLATAPVEVKRRYRIPYLLAKIGIRCLPARMLSLLFQWFSPAFSFIAKKE